MRISTDAIRQVSYPLDVGELRTAFDLSASVAEKARAFRLDGLQTIETGKTPVPVREAAKLVVHVASLTAFASAGRIGRMPDQHGGPNSRPLAGTARAASRICTAISSGRGTRAARSLTRNTFVPELSKRSSPSKRTKTGCCRFRARGSKQPWWMARIATCPRSTKWAPARPTSSCCRCSAYVAAEWAYVLVPGHDPPIEVDRIILAGIGHRAPRRAGRISKLRPLFR